MASAEAHEVPISARETLIAMLDEANPFDHSPADLRGLQNDAAREMFLEMRSKIPVLDNRARECGLVGDPEVENLPSLLLAHSSYKSYPQSFIARGRWSELRQWLSMVSTEDFLDVDLTGVADIDAFLDRMWESGYTISTSSGTSGKVSFLPKNLRDLAIWRNCLSRFRGPLPNTVTADQGRHFFGIGPGSGATTSAYSMGFFCEDFGRPDSRHLLMNEKLSVAKLGQMAELRVKMQNGTALPDEIRQMQEEAARQGQVTEEQFDALANKLMAVRHEPIFIQAMTPQLVDLVARLKAKGVGEGEFHPQSIVGYGGGNKHFTLPEDWETQVKAFFGKVVYSKAYGMTEMNWSCPHCSAGHYHIPPIIIPYVLERDGSRLVSPHSGLVRGRMGFIDVSTQIRWGGMISGDEVEVDLDGNCPCGHRSANIRSVRRYSDITDDDKIQCAAATDAYVRGSFSNQIGF